jgi:transposase
VTPLERKARGTDLVAAQFIHNPEPLLGHKARINKDGKCIMQQHRTIVGIDVSKHTLDYVWLPHGKSEQAMNTPEGIASLVQRLQTLQPDMVVLEATGGYQDALASALHDAGIAYAVVNPRQVRDFARSLNRLGKTDKLDALTLAQFGESRKLAPTIPLTPGHREIAFLLTRREQIQGMIIAEKNHMEHASSKYLPEILDHVMNLGQRLKAIDKKIQEIIASTPEFAEQDRIVQSIPGVGPVMSATFIAGLPEIALTGRKQLGALVGLAPFNRDSGKYRGQRHIFAGRAKVRKVLYCVLRPCLQFNPVVKKWFEKFRAAGKPYKVAAIACARKLLMVIRAMIISKTLWDASKYEHLFIAGTDLGKETVLQDGGMRHRSPASLFGAPPEASSSRRRRTVSPVSGQAVKARVAKRSAPTGLALTACPETGRLRARQAEDGVKGSKLTLRN